MIISMHDNWVDAHGEHSRYLASLLSAAVAAPPEHYKSPATLPFLRKVSGAIVHGGSWRLRRTIPVFQTTLARCGNEQLRDNFRSDLARVFNYEKFASKSTKGWNAFRLCSRARLKTCPYCNEAHIETIVPDPATGSVKGLRPDLDHFLSKSDFPHLALSLLNLVPCCSICNSRLKGKADFWANPHLHPFLDEEAIHFSLLPPDGNIVDLCANFASVAPTLALRLQHDASDQASKNSLATFILEQRYAKHRDEALRFAQLRLALTREKLEEYAKLGMPFSVAALLQFEVANYKSTSLGKMRHDLDRQFGR